jgi:hypothetical protein
MFVMDCGNCNNWLISDCPWNASAPMESNPLGKFNVPVIHDPVIWGSLVLNAWSLILVIGYFLPLSHISLGITNFFAIYALLSLIYATLFI